MKLERDDWSNVDFLPMLESTLQVVAGQVKDLCEYLQELRINEQLHSNYSELFIADRINSICNKIPVFPVMKPLACGTTKNNIDQFNWMDYQLNRHNPGHAMTNISIAPWSNIKRKIKINTNAKQEAAKIISNYLIKNNLEKYHADFLIKYSLNFIKFFIAFSFLKIKLCPFICVANDHTPTNMGFAKAAKSHGIYTIYLQHAFVTKLFPSLDFDLSVLFNRKSAEIYGAESKLDKSVLIVPRYPVISFLENELIYKKEINNTKKKIVIYLGGSNNINVIMDSINRLKSNPFVDDVVVKLHPNPNNHAVKERLIENYGPDIVDVIDIDYPHIAICGNSSVVIKLLSMGVRCYHLFDLDTRKRDYYGFNASEAAPELTLPKLDSKFWIEWNEAQYREIRSKYIEDLDSDNVENNLINFDIILRERLSRSGRLIYVKKFHNTPNLKKEVVPDYELPLTLIEYSYLNTLLFCVSGGLSNINLQSKLNSLSAQEKISLIIRCYNFRHPRALDLMLAAVKFDTSPWVQLFFKYRSGFLVNLKEILNFESDIEFIYSNKCKLKYPEIITSEILNYFSSVEWRNLPPVLNILNKYPVNYEKISIKIFDKAYSKLSKNDRLELSINEKLISLINEIKIQDLNISSFKLHSDLSNFYLSTATGDAKDYMINIFHLIEKWIYDEGIEDLRMARLNDDLIDRFWQLVKDALSSGSGFSFIRLGDGEAYIYSSMIFSVDDCRNRERHWWGCELHESHRSRLQQQLISAVVRSDVIGLPSVFRFMRDLPAHSLSKENLYKSVQRRGLLEITNGFMLYKSQTIAVVEERANDYLFENFKSRLLALSPLIKNVVLVSSLPEHVINTEFAEFSEFVHIKVPTRSRTFNQPDRDLPEGKILPYLYKDVIELVRHHSSSGVVLLVASGVIGKLFLDIGKQYGAVALDIGELAERLGN
jgi:hypothetical protein